MALSNTPGNTSLPHQPPRYGVSSSKPVMSVWIGPTSVPCLVAQASTVPGRCSIRRMILSSSSASFSECSSHCSSFVMKNVVRPESP